MNASIVLEDNEPLDELRITALEYQPVSEIMVETGIANTSRTISSKISHLKVQTSHHHHNIHDIVSDCALRPSGKAPVFGDEQVP